MFLIVKQSCTQCVCIAKRGNSDQFRGHDPLSPSNASADIVWFQSTKLNTFMKMIFFSLLVPYMYAESIFSCINKTLVCLFDFIVPNSKHLRKWFFFSLLVHVCLNKTLVCYTDTTVFRKKNYEKHKWTSFFHNLIFNNFIDESCNDNSFAI